MAGLRVRSRLEVDPKMRLFYLTIATVMLLGGLIANASAQERTELETAKSGRELALHDCNACHIVAVGPAYRPFVGRYAPSFSDIANKPNTTEEALRTFLSHLSNTHMPHPDLAPSDVNNVVVYIMSLRGNQ